MICSGKRNDFYFTARLNIIDHQGNSNQLHINKPAFTSGVCWDQSDIPTQLRMITNNFNMIKLFCKSTVIKSGLKSKHGNWTGELKKSAHKGSL